MREQRKKQCKCGREIALNQKTCKECRKLVDRAFYQKNQPQLIATKSSRKRDILDWYRGLKTGKPCFHCGGSFHFCAMDFDHRDGSLKKDDVSHMVRIGLSKDRILEEIQKTVLLCSNCHRLRTFNRLKGKSYGY